MTDDEYQAVVEMMARRMGAVQNWDGVFFHNVLSESELQDQATAALSALGLRELVEALETLLTDIEDYETVNNLAPNPGKSECWRSVSYARTALARLKQGAGDAPVTEGERS